MHDVHEPHDDDGPVQWVHGSEVWSERVLEHAEEDQRDHLNGHHPNERFAKAVATRLGRWCGRHDQGRTGVEVIGFAPVRSTTVDSRRGILTPYYENNNRILACPSLDRSKIQQVSSGVTGGFALWRCGYPTRGRAWP
jgi:hypothetical protein